MNSPTPILSNKDLKLFPTVFHLPKINFWYTNRFILYLFSSLSIVRKNTAIMIPNSTEIIVYSKYDYWEITHFHLSRKTMKYAR